MTAILEDGGYETAAYQSLSDWAPGAGGSAIMTHTEEEEIERAIRLHVSNFPQIPVVAIMREPTLAAMAHLLRIGVVCVVDENEKEPVFPHVMGAALNGRTSLPTNLARSMAEHVPSHHATEKWVNDDESDWLRSMAAGRTVGEVAEIAGYSERAMFRLLRKLYVRIGVANRTEALMWASRNGILSESSGSTGSGR